MPAAPEVLDASALAARLGEGPGADAAADRARADLDAGVDVRLVR